MTFFFLISVLYSLLYTTEGRLCDLDMEQFASWRKRPERPGPAAASAVGNASFPSSENQSMDPWVAFRMLIVIHNSLTHLGAVGRDSGGTRCYLASGVP